MRCNCAPPRICSVAGGCGSKGRHSIALSWGQMEAVFGWVAAYGYGALFGLLILGIVGVPVPDETLLVFCGYLISRGKLNLTETYIAALAGSCCGITISYAIGRTAGLAAVHRFGRYLRINQK